MNGVKKRIFSGIQPSGSLHIGNYIGAIRQWVRMQDEYEPIFCIVDLHAITVHQEPKILKDKIFEVSALYLACEIDPQKSKIFVQSENPDHSYLAWIFDCVIPTGWMNRMTQFKDKSEKQKESTTVGLFNYPALMAADILLYDTDVVPVGEDQVQHIELTRDVAKKFNSAFGTTFKLPQPMVDKEAARIMSLQNPNSKMSKSDNDPHGVVNLLDNEDQIRDKIKRAVTDSGQEIVYREDKPAISNLLVIFSKLSDKTITEIEKEYQSSSYSKFKEDLSELVVKFFKPIQDRYSEIRNDESYLKKILKEGLDFAKEKSSSKIVQVKTVMGLGV